MTVLRRCWSSSLCQAHWSQPLTSFMDMRAPLELGALADPVLGPDAVLGAAYWLGWSRQRVLAGRQHLLAEGMSLSGECFNTVGGCEVLCAFPTSFALTDEGRLQGG